MTLLVYRTQKWHRPFKEKWNPRIDIDRQTDTRTDGWMGGQQCDLIIFFP